MICTLGLMLITPPCIQGGWPEPVLQVRAVDGILDTVGSRRGEMEALSDLIIDRFRELSALLDFD